MQNVLVALDIGRGERVVLVTNDCPEMIAWLLGSMRSGVVPVPVSTMLRPTDVAAIAADAAAAAIVLSMDHLVHAGSCTDAVGTLRHVVQLDEFGDGQSDTDCTSWSQLV